MTAPLVHPAGTRSSLRGASDGPRSLAVLPFKNIGGNPDLNYLGVGLADVVFADVIVRAATAAGRGTTLQR